MSIIPDEELKSYGSLNLAPMVDFLFLIVAVFATLAVTRAALFDGEVRLVKLQNPQPLAQENSEHYVINLSVTEKGQYKWITEFNEYLIGSASGIQQELAQQQDLGLLPREPERIKVLLHIDKAAQWEPIAQVIFAIKQTGIPVHPVYDIDDSSS